MARAWVALGSNLDNPPAQLRRALEKLAPTQKLTVTACSRFYRSAPLGPPGQSDYCNAVCAVQTELSPLELLRWLHEIEDAAGRVRGGTRWGPRVLDLDLLLYDDLVLDTPELTLPHPQMHLRNFVLVPLAELSPDLTVPRRGVVSDLLRALSGQRLDSWPA